MARIEDYKTLSQELRRDMRSLVMAPDSYAAFQARVKWMSIFQIEDSALAGGRILNLNEENNHEKL